MTSDKKLGDYVKGGSDVELKVALEAFVKMTLNAAEWIRINTPRNQENLLIYNLLRAVKEFVHLLALSTSEHISLLSLATRNIYELNLQLRLLMSDKNQFEIWASEAVTDKIQMLAACRATR